MDVILALSLFVITLTLWTYIPAGVRLSLRHAAGGVLATLRHALSILGRIAYRLLCIIFDVPHALPTVKRLPPPAPLTARQKIADARTDGRTDLADAGKIAGPNLRLDRTREALITHLLTLGWTVTDIRKVLKGENAAIAAEVEGIKAQLVTLDPPPLIVRDAHGEREIART